MRTPLLGFLLALWMLIGSIPSVPAQTPIGAIFGGALACDPASVDCLGPLITISVLCGPGATCPRTFAVDPSNGLNFYGVNGTGKRSTNGGTVWGNFLAEPAVAGYNSVGVTSNGTVLTIGPNGANCIIFRSVDGTASWSQVYNATPGCNSSVSTATIKCTGIVCVVAAYTAPNTQFLGSGNDGLTWSVDFTGTNLANPITLFWDGTIGLAGGFFGDSDEAHFTTTGRSGWTLTPGVVNAQGCFGVTDSTIFSRAIACDLTTRRYVNVISGVATVVTLPNYVRPASGPASLSAGGNQYQMGIAAAAPNCPIWILTGGTVFQQLTCTFTGSGTPGDLIFANGAIYLTTGASGAAALFARITR